MKYTILTIPGEDNTSFFEELWQAFYNTFLNPDEYYENLNMTFETVLSVRMIIVGLFIGFAVAGFAVVFNKRVLGAFVRKLLKEECLSPDSAKTLEALGYKNNLVIRYAVKYSTTLRRVVKCREEIEFDTELEQKRAEYEKLQKDGKKSLRFKETRYDIDTLFDSFYIPEDQKYTADIKFEEKGSSWLGVIICTIVLAIALVAVLAVLPQILGLVNDLAGGIDKTPNNIL